MATRKRHYPILTPSQAWSLAGKGWLVAGHKLYFAKRNLNEPGVTPWSAGFEGKAYPLFDKHGTPAAFAKFFSTAAYHPKRVSRTKWLAKQRVFEWTPELWAAPRSWVSTEPSSRPDGIGFDIACSLAAAVPGRTWRLVKSQVASNEIPFSPEQRLKCMLDLVRGIAVLERNGIMHGDLSDNNIIVNLNASSDEPSVYLIDFDAFFAPRAGSPGFLSTKEGGTIGTPGYTPTELLEQKQANPTKPIAPFSDRFARDTLLFELGCFENNCDPEEAASLWDAKKRRKQSNLIRNLGLGTIGDYFSDRSLFEHRESRRMTSEKIAKQLGVVLPKRHTRSATVETTSRQEGRLAQALGRSLKTANTGLWYLCVTLWSIFCFSVTNRMLGLSWELGDDYLVAVLAVLAQVFVIVGSTMGGIARLSTVAFADVEDRVVAIFGINVVIQSDPQANKDREFRTVTKACKLLTISAALIFFNTVF